MNIEHNIRKHGKRLRCRVSIDGNNNEKFFDNIEDARNYRDNLLKQRSSINAKIALAIELFVSGMNYPEITKVTGFNSHKLNRYISKYFPYKGLDPVTITLQSKV